MAHVDFFRGLPGRIPRADFWFLFQKALWDFICTALHGAVVHGYARVGLRAGTNLEDCEHGD
jgi:hypothetical protein